MIFMNNHIEISNLTFYSYTGMPNSVLDVAKNTLRSLRLYNKFVDLDANIIRNFNLIES